MSTSALVAGVGMIPFAKPGSNKPYPEMAAVAVREALADAGLSYANVQQAYVGYVYGDSTAGERALYEVGMSGIPIVNVFQSVLHAPIVLMGFGLPNDNLHAPNGKFHVPNFYNGIRTSIAFLHELAHTA